MEMDINRYKLMIVFLSMIIICFCLLPLSVNAASRGITVKAKTSSGMTKEIRLYSGYYALIVGCGDYQSGWPKLPNPVKDAREVATTLKNMGWKIDVLENPEGRFFQRKLNQLIVGPGRDKNKGILLWFSGHGYTLKEADGLSLGYLVPIDAPDPEKDEIGFMEKAVSMRYIETIAKRIQAKHVLMVFDSCFSGAIFQMVRAKPSAYIQEKVAEPVRQFITAGNETEQVPDRSVFKDVFIQGIHKGFADRNYDGYVTGEELGAYLQEKVINYSRKAQHPQFGKINNPKLDKGDFVFLVASSSAVIENPPPKPSKAHLYVDTKPKDVRVRILNIGPKFYQGIELDAGKYHVEVSAKGYETQKMWVLLTAGQDRTLNFHLKPIVTDQTIVSQDQKVVNSLSMEFVYLPPGTFMMGSPSNELGRENDEKQHRVTLTKGFYIQTSEVTQGQWKAVMGNNPSWFNTCGDNCPVEDISWNDVQNFIRKLNLREGGNCYRLPTEAEWEYAARAGSPTAFANGGITKTGCAHDTNLDAMGWYCGNSKDKTHSVAQKKANAWGLYDMHGNVWEWCQDWYGNYTSGAVTNPTGASSGSYRVSRGGCYSFSFDARSCRSAKRGRSRPSNRLDFVGFRLVKDHSIETEKQHSSLNYSVTEPKVIARDGNFIAYANGVVYDKKTGLEWYAGPDIDTNWNQAKALLRSHAKLNIAGGGWRMPTRKELKTLYRRGTRARNMTHLLKSNGLWVWSGEIKDSSSAWGFGFSVGYEYWENRNASSGARGFAVRSRKK
jgi:formylglycine-generating enzyme required for sulfatase activity